MMSVRKTSIPAKMRAMVVARRVVVQIRHFLVVLMGVSAGLIMYEKSLSVPLHQVCTTIENFASHKTSVFFLFLFNHQQPLPTKFSRSLSLPSVPRKTETSQTKETTPSNSNLNKGPRRYVPSIPQTLSPTHQTQQTEALRLHLNRDVKFLRNRIRAKGDPARRPQKHHGRREAFGRFGAVVAPDLGHELDAPAYGADCAEDVGRGWDGGLGGHLCENVERKREKEGGRCAFFVLLFF